MITHDRLTRRFAFTVSIVQFGAALSGVLLGPGRFSNETYRPARDMFDFLPGPPSVWWSALLGVLALTAIVCLTFRWRQAARYAFAGLCGYWTFWVVLYTAAWANPTAGPWAPWLALMCVAGNARPVLARVARPT